MSAHKESALTTTNPAYEIMKHGGGGRHEYELGGSAETDPPTADVTYEIPSPPSHQPPSHQPPSHQPPSNVPLSVAPGVVGVASGGGEEGVYEN